MTKQAFYREKIEGYTSAVQSFKNKIAFSALLRLAAFGAFAFSFYYLIKAYSISLLVFTIILLILFVAAVKHAIRLREKKELLEKLLFVNQNELTIIEGGLNSMDDGKAFSVADGYDSDLDIFGNKSLYHLLNRCTTTHGKDRLAALLMYPLLQPGDIIERQDALTVFSPQADKRQQITAYGLLHKEEEGNLHTIKEWLQTGKNLHEKKWLRVARWILILYNIPCFILYIDNGNISYLLAGVAMSWLLMLPFVKYIHQQHQLISKKQAVLYQYADILSTFSEIDTGNSTLLKQLQTTAQQAHGAISRLAKLSSMFDQRLNLLVNVFLNSIILYDLYCILGLEKWKAQHSKAFDQWLFAVGDIECLNALASFAFNNAHFVYPTVVDSKNLSIETTAMGHPLIAAKERVTNDFEAGKTARLLLVTGSNMSGKTTFLRTLGINLILAQCGAPVCALNFVFTPMKMLTSIRVNDSLQEHTSYFMAELKRLQLIIQQLQQGIPALVLIDEILRGTNSEDKTHGSEQFILQLIRYNCITLFATHDLTLASLENDHKGVISNCCFESIIQNNTLYFDYKLQRGVAKNKNASFLMKQMGIIEE